jgi:RimJ/RimL family protein N-acetyltransferase
VTQLTLVDVLLDATRGRFPPADGAVDVVPVPDGELEAVLALTGHAVIQADIGVEDALQAGADGFGGATSPAFLLWLAGGGWISSHDVVLWAAATGEADAPAKTTEFDDHPRVVAARRIRRDVRVHGDDHGIVTIGRGLGDQWELGVQIASEHRGSGSGRRLIAAARALRPLGEPLFAHVAPGNAASLRAFLAAGFVPLGSVVMIRPGSRP